MQKFIDMVYTAVVDFLGIFEDWLGITHPTSSFCAFVLVIIVILSLLILYMRLWRKYKRLMKSIE